MDFTAYMSHSLTKPQIIQLSNELNRDIAQFSLIHNFINELLPFNAKDDNNKWRINLDHLGGTIRLNGPCGVSLTLSEKVCYIHHYFRWRNFLLDNEIQHLLRTVSYGFMKIFNSQFVIYVPDSSTIESAIMDFIWEDENKDINFIREWLLINCGPPKNNIKDICKDFETYWESEGYYIDFFKDFEEP